MADVLSTKNIQLPREIASEIVTKARDASVIQTLSTAKPVLFQDTTNIFLLKRARGRVCGRGRRSHFTAGRV